MHPKPNADLLRLPAPASFLTETGTLKVPTQSHPLQRALGGGGAESLCVWGAGAALSKGLSLEGSGGGLQGHLHTTPLCFFPPHPNSETIADSPPPRHRLPTAP